MMQYCSVHFREYPCMSWYLISILDSSYICIEDWRNQLWALLGGGGLDIKNFVKKVEKVGEIFRPWDPPPPVIPEYASVSTDIWINPRLDHPVYGAYITQYTFSCQIQLKNTQNSLNIFYKYIILPRFNKKKKSISNEIYFLELYLETWNSKAYTEHWTKLTD